MLKKVFSLVLVVSLLFAGAGLAWAAEPIKVGAPLCLTGPYAGDGLGYWRGIKMAVDEVRTNIYDGIGLCVKGADESQHNYDKRF